MGWDTFHLTGLQLPAYFIDKGYFTAKSSRSALKIIWGFFLKKKALQRFLRGSLPTRMSKAALHKTLGQKPITSNWKKGEQQAGCIYLKYYLAQFSSHKLPLKILLWNCLVAINNKASNLYFCLQNLSCVSMCTWKSLSLARQAWCCFPNPTLTPLGSDLFFGFILHLQEAPSFFTCKGTSSGENVPDNREIPFRSF